MPKELFLVRHAEAENNNFDIKDIERSLTSQGEITASKVGKLMSRLINTPDLILCSSAVRTRKTTELISEQLQYNINQIEVMDDLYEASTRILLRVINSISNENKKVILVGHNPSLSFLAEYMTGALIGNVNTGGVIHLKVSHSWQEVSAKNVDFIQYYDPTLF